MEHIFTASPQSDRHAILYVDILLHPEDRALAGLEWPEVGRRLARAAGIEFHGDEHGCLWDAGQVQPLSRALARHGFLAPPRVLWNGPVR